MTALPPSREPRRPRKISPRSRLIGIVLALVAVGGLGWLVWHVTHPAAPASGQQAGAGAGRRGPGGGPGGRGRRGPPTTVGVATATTADLPVIIEALGTATPTATVTVRPQVSGVIIQVFYREGQTVRRGQPLVQIDPRPYQNALMQAQGNLARDQAQLDNAKLTLGRYQTLLTQDSIARQDVDTQAALVRQLQGVVTTDQASVATARLNLGYAHITSPVAGRVGLRVVDVGNYIGAGDSGGVAIVTTIAPIDVVFTVPQDDVPRVAARAATGEALPAVALDRTRTVTLDSGAFSTLDNKIDATTGTVKAKARFPNARTTLYPSQFVNLRLQLDTVRNAVVVPSTAVRQSQDSAFVWLVGDGQMVHRRNVKLGQSANDRIAVTEGLAAGDKVVTEGGDRLTEGARIQLPGQAPRGPGAQGAGRGGRRRGGQEGAQAGAAENTQGGAQGAARNGGQGRGGQGGGGRGAGGQAPAAD